MFTELASIITGMKLSDWAAIAFGITGIIFSVVALRQSSDAEKRSRKTAMEQKQIRALQLISQSEDSLRNLKLKLLDIEDEAKEEGVSHVQEIARGLITQTDVTISDLALRRKDLSLPLPDRSQWPKLEAYFHNAEVRVQGLNQVSTTEDFIRSAKASIRVRKRNAEEGVARRSFDKAGPTPPSGDA